MLMMYVPTSPQLVMRSPPFGHPPDILVSPTCRAQKLPCNMFFDVQLRLHALLRHQLLIGIYVI
jgi:hypothetical protein